jgi:motility quorum-sensing regulator / GCU-specific mRNA interferase toxin
MINSPTYALEKVRWLLQAKAFLVTRQAIRDAFDLGLDRTQIVAVVEALRPSDFYKSMPSRVMPGLMQDVYRTSVGSRRLYVKIQIKGSTPDDLVVVISFKEL